MPTGTPPTRTSERSTSAHSPEGRRRRARQARASAETVKSSSRDDAREGSGLGDSATGARRLNKARRIVGKLRDRRSARRMIKRQRIADGLRTPRRKRKAALAASASIMTLSTAAVDIEGAAQQTGYVETVDTREIRMYASMIEPSEELKEAMIEEEGVRLTVYRDVAGYPTVGVGHLVTSADGLSVGDRISEERALDFFEQDLAIAQRAVEDLVGDLKLYQHEYDALIDLAFNVGEGTLAPQKSPRLNTAIDMRDYEGMAKELAYHHAKGSIANGLVYRSERRTNIFLEAEYDDPRELNA